MRRETYVSTVHLSTDNFTAFTDLSVEWKFAD